MEKNFVITGNIVRNCAGVGIFHETVMQGSCTGNTIDSCGHGIYVNRINGEPRQINISGNSITGVATGVSVIGETGGVMISNNTIKGFTNAGVRLGGGGVVRRVLINGNFFIPNTSAIPCISNNTATDSSVIYAWNNSAIGTTRTESLAITGPVSAFYVEEIKLLDLGDISLKHYGGVQTNLASGGSFTIPVKASTAGRLFIKASSGGGWRSYWNGSFIAGTTRVDVTVGTTDFLDGDAGNAIASVVDSAVDLNITVNMFATGSSGNFDWYLEYI